MLQHSADREAVRGPLTRHTVCDGSVRPGEILEKRLRLAVVCLLPFLFLVPLGAQQTIRQSRLQVLDQEIVSLAKEWRVPGLAIAIVKDNEVVYAKGFGVRDAAQGLRVTPVTLFPIASCTKSFTAAALAVLVDEAKLDWDKPVKQYWGGFQLSDEYVASHITVRDLLAQRSGLPQHYRMYFHSSLTRREIVERVRFLKLSRELRESFQYSNLNYVIAAHLLERITGKTWEEFVREKIFTPLEMKDSNFFIPDRGSRADYALPYREENGAIKQVPFFDVGAMGPAGSISSSALDMANWMLMQLNRGAFQGRQIISERGLRQMHAPQMTMPSTPSDEVFYSSYGMGWGVTSYRGHLLLSHGGGFDGFSGLVSLLPRDNLGIVVLTNLEGNPVPTIITNATLDRLLGLSEIPWNERVKGRVAKAKEAGARTPKGDGCEAQFKPAHSFDTYAGTFQHPAYGTLRVFGRDGQLQVVHNGLSTPIRHCQDDSFETISEEFGNYRLTFLGGGKGAFDRVAVPFEPAVDDIVFARVLAPHR